MKIPVYYRIFAAFLLLLLWGCVVARGVFHPVKEGETLWRICRTYGVDMQEVAEFNNIRDPRELRAGTRIFIPGATRVLKIRPRIPSDGAEEEKEGRIVVEKGRFSWPVKGRVIKTFGIKGGMIHDGIDIEVTEGAAVRAASDGTVVFSDNSIKGFGNMVIIRHSGDFYTVYARGAENLVKVGEAVKRGDVIARAGRTKAGTAPHIHFEVRQGRKVRNPLFFLP